MHRSSRYLAVALFVMVLSAVDALAACALRDAALAARQKAEAAHDAYRKVQLDPALDEKLNQFYARMGWLNDDPDVDEANKEARALFTKEELGRLKPYIQAYEARRLAEAEARRAEKAWYDEFKKKDDALAKAEAKFNEEQAWLNEQKKDIVGKPIDDAILTRTAVVVWRLQHSYKDMIDSLAAYRECYPDARSFIEDLEKRLARLKALEKQIADERAKRDKPPGDPTAPATRPADPAGTVAKTDAASGLDPANDARDLGAWWVCKGAVPKSQGQGITVTEKGASWTEKTDQGEGTGKATITTAPPARIRVGQAFKVVMTVEATHPGSVIAGWYNNNYASGDPLSDEGSSATSWPEQNSTKKGPHNVAVLHFRFGPHDERYPCWIEARMVQPGHDYLPSGSITWVYEKE